MLNVLTVDKEEKKMLFNEVLKSEIGKLEVGKYNLEVIKALVVLKRSELMKKVRSSPYYSNYDSKIIFEENSALTIEENNVIEGAIEATKGIIVLYGEKAVNLYYSRSCGGGTSNSEDVIGVQISYLRKVLCKLCGTDYKVDIINVSDIAKKFNISSIDSKLEIKGVLTNVNRDETGRIININVLGHPMNGDEFAKYIGCNSSRIYFQENSIAFKSIGEGNGLGICLAGAQVLTQKGYKYKELIEYYYTGISFVEFEEVCLLNSLWCKKIVIDPGHGGSDEGNSFGSIIEKNVNLTIALELEKKLKEMGAQVILTRSSDINVPLGNRVNTINLNKPDFFISLHQNSFMFKSTNGVEAYCYEMDTDGIKLSECIEFYLNQDLKIKNRGVKIGDYYLLRESKVSGVILECMYMSGDCDSLMYNSNNYVDIAHCIFKGICAFYDIE